MAIMIFLLIFTGMGSVSIDFPTSTTNKLLQQAAAASAAWAYAASILSNIGEDHVLLLW